METFQFFKVKISRYSYVLLFYGILGWIQWSTMSIVFGGFLFLFFLDDEEPADPPYD